LIVAGLILLYNMLDMFFWLKKNFIPHKKNKYQPHILRNRATKVILGLIFLIEIYFLAQAFLLVPFTNLFATIIPNTLIVFTNSSRQINSLPELQVNALLVQAAQLKAEDMATNGYFAHISPAGVSPWHWLDKVGYQYSYAGENLAINFADSKDVTDAWMNSPAHRANVLSNNFSEIGIGTAKGVYQGQETTFIVELFAKPVLAAPGQGAVVPKLEPTKLKPAEKIESALVPPPQDMFVAVKGVSEQNINVSVPLEPEVKKEPEVFSLAKCFFSFKCLITAPRSTTNFLFIILAAIFSAALVLKIFIKIKIQHPKLILNSLIVLFVIASMVYLNYYLLSTNARIF
jgi:hypothetical protein